MLLYRFLLEIIPYFCVQVTCIRIILPRYPGQDPYSDWRSLPDQGLVGNNDQHSIFVFPGYVNWARITSPPRNPVISTRQNVHVPDMSAIAKNCPLTSTFCESVDNYPADYINNKIDENLDRFAAFFQSDANANKRIGIGSEDVVSLCPAEVSTIQPAAAVNIDQQWRYIVNSDKYVQYVRVERCKSINTSCPITSDVPPSFETKCVQKYVFRKLVALDEHGETHTDSFRLPSCCVCIILSSN